MATPKQVSQSLMGCSITHLKHHKYIHQYIQVCNMYEFVVTDNILLQSN